MGRLDRVLICTVAVFVIVVWLKRYAESNDHRLIMDKIDKGNDLTAEIKERLIDLELIE